MLSIKSQFAILAAKSLSNMSYVRIENSEQTNRVLCLWNKAIHIRMLMLVQLHQIGSQAIPPKS